MIRGTLLAQRFLGTDKGGRGGVVVNTGSNVSINPYVSTPIYSATKAAIVSFTRTFGVSFKLYFMLEILTDKTFKCTGRLKYPNSALVPAALCTRLITFA